MFLWREPCAVSAKCETGFGVLVLSPSTSTKCSSAIWQHHQLETLVLCQYVIALWSEGPFFKRKTWHVCYSIFRMAVDLSNWHSFWVENLRFTFCSTLAYMIQARQLVQTRRFHLRVWVHLFGRSRPWGCLRNWDTIPACEPWLHVITLDHRTWVHMCIQTYPDMVVDHSSMESPVQARRSAVLGQAFPL